MKQEDKELLLKDLCARLPYYTKLYSEYAGDNWAILTPVVYSHTANCSPDEIRIKPYLFPLSSMTEEQKKEFDQLLELELKAVNDEINHTQATVFEVDFYNKHHLDWRGLIPKGLALDASGKNIY